MSAQELWELEQTLAENRRKNEDFRRQAELYSIAQQAICSGMAVFNYTTAVSACFTAAVAASLPKGEREKFLRGL